MKSPDTTPLRRAILVALGLPLAAAPAAHAQDQDDAEELETITVVGSRIKRTDIETSQPVFVIEREDLQKTGLVSIGDIIQRLTSSGATLNTTYNNGGDGSTLVDLRNLGANRTLVLVNGRRWVSNLAGSVDLNTIPSSIIERVEVLKDGASAIYGSDAIAGVINFTLRDNYDGAEASAYLGEYDEGDGRVEQYDFTIGSSTDRASVVLNATYAKAESVFAGDREISAVPVFGFGGNDSRVGASTTTPFGRFGFGPGGDRLPNGGAGTLTLIPGRAGTSAADFRPFDLVTDAYNFAPENYLSTPQERTSLYAQARYNVTDSVSFSTTVLYNERKSSQQLAAMPFVFGTAGAGLARFVVSGDSIYNPFGVDVTRAQFRNRTQFREYNQDVDTFYFGAGFDGSFDLFDRSWSWDVNYVYTDNEEHDLTYGFFDLNRLRTGLGPSFVDASGAPTCGTPEAPIAGCVPLNIFGGPEAFTREMVDYAAFTAQDNLYKKLYNYTANLTGDLFELPAGPLSFAAGYEYRREFGYDQPDALIAAGASTGNIRQPTSGGFALDEFYVEFNVPILKDLAFAEILEVSLATRYSDYSNFGDTTNPKFGFRWKPFADLLVRGNYADGFRAPAISELFLGNSDTFPTIFDPCSESQEPEGDTLARCRGGFGGIAPTPAGYEQTNNQIRITVGGNADLRPEISTSKTLGLVYSPSWLEGLDVYLDWYNIEIIDSIGQNSGQFIVEDCYLTGNLSSCALITRAPNGDILDLFAGSRNLPGGTEVEGYDLTVNYRFDTTFGKFSVNWDTAYTSYIGDVGQPDFLEELPDGSISFGNLAGVSFDRGSQFHRIKSNVTTSWQLGDWGATLGFRYLSNLDEDCAYVVLFDRPELCSNPGGSPQNPDGENNLDDTWYTDLQVTWDSPWNSRIAVGARNLLDEDPPIAFTTFANSFHPEYDIPGRFWYVQYTQRF